MNRHSFAVAAPPTMQIAADSPVFVTVPVAYLVPVNGEVGQLTVHTADFRVNLLPDNGLSVSFDGLYRLVNEGDESTTVAMTLSFPHSEAIPVFDLSANGFPLSATPSDDGYDVSVQAPVESTVNVRLRYTVSLPPASLLRLRYDARRLAVWPGNPSLRVAISLPEALPAENWLSVAPDGWSYTTPTEDESLDRVGIHWLYDGAWPADAFLLWTLSPQSAQTLGALQSARVDPAQSRQLGDLYASFYLALPQATDADAALRERLYAQALAAYTAALNRIDGTNGEDTGLLWAGLANLYRSRAVASGTVDVAYTTLMVQAATSALRSLSLNDGRRPEVQQWQADGLRQLLADAQQRRDWPAAVALLDQMATLPEPPLSPAAMAEERRAATVLQALTLLEAGQQQTATELAGDEILNAELQPDTDLQSLFAAWHISTTLTVDGIELDVQVQSVPNRADAARDALTQQLIDSPVTIPGVNVQMEEQPTPDGELQLNLTFTIDDRNGALTMAQSLNPGPDWIFLRTLLEQIAPIVQHKKEMFKQSVSIEQSLDLRAADTQWAAMAENLEERASAIEAQSRGVNVNDPAAIEAALRVRIQAANYRTAANVWRDLAANSWVATQLAASDNDDGRTWLATASTPAQTFTYQTETRDNGRLLMAGGALLALLLLLSGLLWRLL